MAICIENGIKRVLPRAKCIKVPMADGGEGTVQALVDATAGRLIRKQVTGPLGKPVRARYGILGDEITAVIEMAEASGLPLVARERRDPVKATTYGTGELILDALNKGARTMIIGIGGSATVDGGAGMAQALGVKFLQNNGQPVPGYCGGGTLDRIASIDISRLDPRVREAKITIASDVDNPLCGPKGAARVFGPQKGATPDMVAVLDRNLNHFAKIIKSELGVEVATLKGAGAAGGLGVGLVAFAKAKLKKGIELVIEAVRLERYVNGADLVITGEGRVDFQTPFGKTPAGVAALAKKLKVPVVAIGGGLTDDAIGVYAHGIDGLEAATAREMSLPEALKHSRQHLENAGERVLRLIVIGQRIQKRLRK